MKVQERNNEPVLEQIARHAGTRLRETTARAGAGLEERFDKIGMRISKARGTVVDTTKKYSRQANTYVKKNPWTSIGLTSGFAFLVGVFIGRRRAD
jgi:ElaB/YqjD/DUF883 family membrane-anchored ribosome-binding protein